jgi:hypothetical protein
VLPYDDIIPTLFNPVATVNVAAELGETDSDSACDEVPDDEIVIASFMTNVLAPVSLTVTTPVLET